MASGELWIDTEQEGQRALDELTDTMRSLGAKDLPILPQ